MHIGLYIWGGLTLALAFGSLLQKQNRTLEGLGLPTMAIGAVVEAISFRLAPPLHSIVFYLGIALVFVGVGISRYAKRRARQRAELG